MLGLAIKKKIKEIKMLVTPLLNRNENCFDQGLQSPSCVCLLQPFCMQLLGFKFSKGQYLPVSRCVRVPVKPELRCLGIFMNQQFARAMS